MDHVGGSLAMAEERREAFGQAILFMPYIKPKGHVAPVA
jgi:hypothetical protein